MIFSRFFRRGEGVEAPPEKDASSPAPAPRSPPPSPTRKAASPVEPEPCSENESELFAEMEKILNTQTEGIQVPCRALLSGLPEEHRGEAYQADAIPEDVFIELDQNDLLQQLRSGKVIYPLDTLAAMLPSGWVRADADTFVELHLPDVVEAIPSDLLRGADQLDEETIEAAQMHDYFRPESAEPVADEPKPEDRTPPELEEPVATESEPEPPAAKPVQPESEAMEPDAFEPPAPKPFAPVMADLKRFEPLIAQNESKKPEPDEAAPIESEPLAAELVEIEPASAKTPKSAPRPPPQLPVWAWDGIEIGRDVGAQALDINEARVEELEAIPGLGRVRAERIIAWREIHGPFHGIYEMAAMPGVGRKLFQRMTGLNPAVTKRTDRHTRLNQWIGLPEDARPGLSEILKHIHHALNLSECVLADEQGIVLASAPETHPHASLLAALTPKLFRRARRYLWRMAPGSDTLLVLPTGKTPLVLLRAGTYYLSATLAPDAVWPETADQMINIGTELEWLLGPRLVVHRTASTSEPGANP